LNQNSFSTYFLDRVSDKREDKSWIKDQLKKDTTRIIPIFESKNFCQSSSNETPIFLTPSELQEYNFETNPFIFLGVIDKKTYFAFDITSHEFESRLCDEKSGIFLDLKQIASLLDYQDCALLSLSRFMVNWHSINCFCGKCGQPTKIREAGNSRVCINDQCKQIFFPSMDPAMIVLVFSGDYCLLGRQKIWPKGMYSTIAGFVEPGESIEDAVFREVKEETGIEVDDIEYQSSQPWLFPSSLMLGFTAKAKTKEIKIAKKELEDARWFSREEIKDNLDKGLMRLSSKVSIAYNLIKTWYNKGSVTKL